MFISLNSNRAWSIGYGWRIAPSTTTTPRSLFMARRSTFCWALLTPLLLVGCSSADSEYLAADILLTSEPDGVQTVLEVREALLGPEMVEHLHEGHLHEGHVHTGHEQEGNKHEHKLEQAQVHDDDDHGHDGDNPKHGHELKQVHDSTHEDHDHHDTEPPVHLHAGHDDPGTQPLKPGPAGPLEVVVVGKIGGLTNPWQQTEPDFPFVKDTAKFFLADPGAVAEQQADGHQHAPGEECAFCAAQGQDNSALLAIVQFKDKQGEILRRDARQWLSLNDNETVVVHGHARIVAGGLLVIDADSLYVRR